MHSSLRFGKKSKEIWRKQRETSVCDQINLHEFIIWILAKGNHSSMGLMIIDQMTIERFADGVYDDYLM